MKRPKISCEICEESDSSILERHHIVPRKDVNSDNSDMNLAVICPTCHSKIHDGSIRIIGVFPGTKPPSGKILVYVKDGVCNVPGLENAEPYYKPKPKSMKVYNGNKHNKKNNGSRV